MQDFIEEIYKYAELVTKVKKIIYKIHLDQAPVAMREWPSLQEPLVDLCKKTAEYDPALGTGLYSSLQSATSLTNGKSGSYILFADALDKVIPLLCQSLKTLSDIDVSEDGLCLKSSESGFLSLGNTQTGTFYHSLNDPMWEAFELAGHLYKPKCTSYYIIGCGLGYLPYSIFEASDFSADIHIFHTSRRIVDYALEYGVLSKIPESKLKITIMKDASELMQAFTHDSENPSVGYASCSDISDFVPEKGKADVINVLIDLNTLNRSERLTYINTYRNIKNVRKSVYDFKPVSDEWLIVAGGPSVDTQAEYIRKCAGLKTVICASTSFKKLLNLGIRPDAVAALDPKARTFKHLDGVTDSQIPLFLSNGANWRFGELYKGPRYLVPWVNIIPLKDYYPNLKDEKWSEGGTVSTLMLEIAAHLGARRIDMLGMDYSYPDGHTHASGTMDNKTVSTAGMSEVPCVKGGTVPTTPAFAYYLSETEKLIRKYPKIKFVNYSDLGARIKGSVWYRELKE